MIELFTWFSHTAFLIVKCVRLFYYLLVCYPFASSRAASLTSHNTTNRITSSLIHLACSANLASHLATHLLFRFLLQVLHFVLSKLTSHPITCIRTHVLFYFSHHSLVRVRYCLELTPLTQLLIIITDRIALLLSYWLSDTLSALLSL